MQISLLLGALSSLGICTLLGTWVPFTCMRNNHEGEAFLRSLRSVPGVLVAPNTLHMSQSYLNVVTLGSMVQYGMRVPLLDALVSLALLPVALFCSQQPAAWEG